MCGIVGIIGRTADSQKERLSQMQNLLRQRGPDDSGQYWGQGALLGHQRLSILDLSSAGKNPIFSEDGRFVIVYNGEIFNFKELRQEIDGRYKFKSLTDTEVVLASYIIWGKDCLRKFVGMFSFAIWDKEEKILFCARDRFGIKPFYYRRDGENLYFASEIKALLVGNGREPDYGAIFNYLYWGLYDHDEKTFFKDIFKLMPGSYLFWQDGQLSISEYWNLDGVNELEDWDVAAAKKELMFRLNESVRFALRSDVPVGVNLSGGLDSSILTVLIDRQNEPVARLEGFTQDYKDPRFSEKEWVLEIARTTKRKVHLSYMSELDFVDSHPKMMWYQDEPYAGVPVSGYIGMYEAAGRQGIKVLLDGNGLDEGFCGYRQYHNIYLESLQAVGSYRFDAALQAYCREWSILEKDARMLLKAGYKLKNTQTARDGSQAVETQWLADEFKRDFFSPAPDFKKPFTSAVKNAMYQDIKYTKMPRALRFNDRVSMAFSKELRVPFLDHRLIELGFSLPDDLLFYGGRPKGLVRETFKDILPDKVRLAPKRHIQTPQSQWLTAGLRSFVGDIFYSHSFKNRGIFDGDKVKNIFNCIGEKPVENSFFLWQAVNLETWFQMFIDEDVSVALPSKFRQFEYQNYDFSLV